ncbi:MAG TPA: hypothetical protein VN193_02865 [Candidatus Angelobacter sp.]|nr:hypothetical protein [Candidatus Angelobacter sp.]
MSTGNGGRVPRGVVLSDLPAVGEHRSTSRRPTSPDVRLEPARRRREVPWILLGIGVCCLSGIGGWVVTSRLAAQYQILVTTRAVPAGHVFITGDLRPASTSATGLDLVLEADEGQIVGHTAAVGVPAGAPLVHGDVGSPAVGPGAVTVAVLCKPGQFPPSLAAGDHVTILTEASPPGGASLAPASGATSAQGVVVAIDTPTDSAVGGTVVTLQVDAASASGVAAAGADGHASLVVTAAGD